MPVVPEEQRAVSRTGEGLANALYSLPRDEQFELSKRFCQLVPAFSDVEAKTHEQYAGRGQHTLIFRDRWKRDFVFTPAEVSDGSLLLLALLLIPFQLEPVDLVLIDEPEASLHPYLLENMVSMFRSLANGTLGRKPIQVVLATHSPTLLNFVDPSEVRFLTRSKDDGSTIIQSAPVDNPDWVRIYSDFDKELGSVWLTGGMGGVPGSS